MRPIALLTDFGLSDPYAGQMKGVLTARAPQAIVQDISHGVQPFQVGQAAFFLAASVPHFPDSTVFVCVVDPGVGTKRRIILAKQRNRYFLAPDNGLLVFALHGEPFDAWDVSHHTERASSTFHGRDVFAPLAAELANGEAPGKLGKLIDSNELVRSEAATPTLLDETQAGRMVQGHVLHIDRFGNVILSLLPGELYQRMSGAPEMETPCSGPAAPRMVRTYGELQRGELGLLLGSQGFLELAVNQGSAADLLEIKLGDIFNIGMPD